MTKEQEIKSKVNILKELAISKTGIFHLLPNF